MPHLTEVSEHPPAVEYAAAYWKLLYELRVTALPTQAPLVRPAHSSMQTAAGPRLKSQAFMLGKTLDQRPKGISRCPRLSRGQGRLRPLGCLGGLSAPRKSTGFYYRYISKMQAARVCCLCVQNSPREHSLRDSCCRLCRWAVLSTLIDSNSC